MIVSRWITLLGGILKDLVLGELKLFFHSPGDFVLSVEECNHHNTTWQENYPGVIHLTKIPTTEQEVAKPIGQFPGPLSQSHQDPGKPMEQRHTKIASTRKKRRSCVFFASTRRRLLIGEKENNICCGARWWQRLIKRVIISANQWECLSCGEKPPELHGAQSKTPNYKML